MPRMVRANYSYELLSSALLPFMLTGVETGVMAVLVRKAFDGVVPAAQLNVIVAVIGASKALANVVSFLWVRLNHGHDKVRFILGLQVSMAVLILLLAATPRTPLGLVLLTVGVLATRAIWSGFITIRSTIWNVNYERSVRAVVTGKFATLQVIVIGLLGWGMGEAMDANENSFRVLLVVGVVIGAVGIWSWSRVRVRGERRLRREERRDDGGPSFNPLAMFSLLAGDRPFAAYMGCMFVLGTGNLMVGPLVAIVVVEKFHLGYEGGIRATNTIPFLLMPVLIPLWSRMLSRMHVVQFRVIHAWVFTLANVLFFLAVWQVQPWLLFVAAGVQGIAFGGGALAWTLGHLDFAPAHRASQYMGVHVTLTGVRGLIAPFVGVTLYLLLEKAGEAGRALVTLDPHPPTVVRVLAAMDGSWVFTLCFTLSATGAVGFACLARWMHVREGVRTEPVETTPPSQAGV